ncbi:MAG: Wzt carbohydrate-binding domain-containing protein, partial [Thermodesulfobacteriota bacterium]
LGSGFNPEFTGRENVYLNTAILGMSKQETDARFEQITEFADIGDFIERPVKTYSSGMNARLAFSTAIAVDPDILIIDEALAVGDIFFQQKCVAHMKKMMDGCTILLVSHDMHSVTNMCDRVIVLDKGKVVFSGNPPEGVAKYTKLIHSREAKKKRGLAESDVLPKQILKAARDTAPDFDLWEEVSDEDRGGSGEINILHYSVTNEGQPITMVQSGDRVSIRLLIQSLASKKDIIFGYTIKDRVGNAIFGENSLCLEDAHFEFDAGYSIVSYDFIWPEVYPDNYTLTIGIGEGTHPLSHKVQCWAHNIVSFKAVTSGVSIHGMFNNPLEQVDVSPLISDSSTV